MPNSLVGALGAKYPDSKILFDDTFEDGFAGWQELHTYQGGDPAAWSNAPLSLRHPSVPGPVLALSSGSQRDPGIHSQAIAMKRVAHMETPKIVDLEVFFAWGGESDQAASPASLFFMVDEMYGGSRHFWKFRWRNWNESTGARTKDWFVSSPGEDTYQPTGFTSDLPWNGNKGSMCRVKVSVDLGARKYLSIEANRGRYDLTTLGAITPPGNNGVPAFDDPLFEDGLNFMVGVVNRTSQDYNGWMAVQRVRASLRSA